MGQHDSKMVSAHAQQQHHLQLPLHQAQHRELTTCLEAPHMTRNEHILFGQSQLLLDLPHGFRLVHDEVENLHRRDGHVIQHAIPHHNSLSPSSGLPESVNANARHTQTFKTPNAVSKQCPTNVSPTVRQVKIKPNPIGKQSYSKNQSSLGTPGVNASLAKR